MADAGDLKSPAARRPGSIPGSGTNLLPVLEQQQEEQDGDEPGKPAFAKLLDDQTDVIGDSGRIGKEDIDDHQRDDDPEPKVGEGAHIAGYSIYRFFYISHR